MESSVLMTSMIRCHASDADTRCRGSLGVLFVYLLNRNPCDTQVLFLLSPHTNPAELCIGYMCVPRRVLTGSGETVSCKPEVIELRVSLAVGAELVHHGIISR